MPPLFDRVPGAKHGNASAVENMVGRQVQKIEKGRLDTQITNIVASQNNRSVIYFLGAVLQVGLYA